MEHEVEAILVDPQRDISRLPARPEQLDPAATVLVACVARRRAAIAASGLVAAGSSDVRVLAGDGVPDLASEAA